MKLVKWFVRKPRNRRFGEREHVLDVRLRTSAARAQRWRVAGGVAGAVLLLFGLWRGGLWLLDCLIYKNDTFAIQQIDVQTDGVINADTIRRWAMVRPGQNLMALDLTRVQRNLETQPPIQFAAVERVLPRTLKLIVNERDPVARAVVTVAGPRGAPMQAIFDFDEEGHVLQPLDPSWRATPAPAGEHLPILQGVAAGDVPLGQATMSSQIRGAIQLIAEFDHSPMAGLVDLKTINVSIPEILQVTTGQGAQVTFSLNQFDVQLRRWRLIYDQYQRWGRAITWLDLSIANNLPVRWVALSGAPTAPVAQPPKTTKPKKKHV